MTIAAHRRRARHPAADAPATGRDRRRLVLVLGALVALGPLSIDMYLPALPRIAGDLLSDEAAAQLTLSGTVLGLGLGQLLVGPLSDAIGRRVPVLVGTGVHVLASLLCLLAPTIELLTAARVLQGLGASAGAVLALAVVRDLYTDRAAAATLSRLILVMGVSPVLAPTLGSALLAWTQWRGVFVALAGLGLAIALFAGFALPETLPVSRRRPLALGATARTYAHLLTDRAFVGLVLVAGMAMAALFGFVSGASFVFQRQFGLSQAGFGLLFGVGAVWLIAATQLNAALLRRWSPERILLLALLAATAAAAGLFALAVAGAGMVATMAGVCAVLFCTGLVLPNAPAVALSRHGETAGTAAALLGAVQFAVGAAVPPVVGLLGSDALAMAIVMVSGLALAALVAVTVARPWRLDTSSPDPALAV